MQSREQLPDATLYTTLEPCTPAVRTDGLMCCTELIKQSGIKRVFIGILDPNQGVTGRGLWTLQDHGIDVELFPPPLSKKIRALNADFIRSQRRLGVRITSPQNGDKIRTWDKRGVYRLEGEATNEPGDDIIVLTKIGSEWWPQEHRLSIVPGTAAPALRWTVDVHFGAAGPHAVYIVRASPLGLTLFDYFRKVGKMNAAARKAVTQVGFPSEDVRKKIISAMPLPYPPISMTSLPKGLEYQSHVEIEVEGPPAR